MAIVRIDAYRSLAFGSISGSFAAVGSTLSHSWRAFCIVNNTDGDMIFSVDGTTNNLFVPAFNFRLYDVAANSASTTEGELVFQKGTQFYVKQSTAPSKGSVYIEGIYAQGE